MNGVSVPIRNSVESSRIALTFLLYCARSTDHEEIKLLPPAARLRARARVYDVDVCMYVCMCIQIYIHLFLFSSLRTSISERVGKLNIRGRFIKQGKLLRVMLRDLRNQELATKFK